MKYRILIDGVNIRSGGTISNLKHLLDHVPDDFEVIIYGTNLLEKILLKKKNVIFHQIGIFQHFAILRIIWQIFFLRKKFYQHNINLLYAPGGFYFGNDLTAVSLSQNLLPFTHVFKASFHLRLKLYLIKYLQKKTFRKSAGVIFLTNYAKEIIEPQVGTINRTTIIPNSVDRKFFSVNNKEFSIKKKVIVEFIYVSRLEEYKNHINLIDAFKVISDEKILNFKLTLIGPSSKNAGKLYHNILKLEKKYTWLSYLGELDEDEIIQQYVKADIGIFASSVENMPIILSEMMAVKIPIICSKHGVMPEIALDSVIYFDPNLVDSIVKAVNESLNVDITRKNVIKARGISEKFKVRNISNQTFNFFRKIINDK